MTLDAAQIAELLEAAEPLGNWGLDEHGIDRADVWSGPEWSSSEYCVCENASRDQARLIAAAPTLARTALDAIAAREAAERERDALREAREDELRAAYIQGAMDVHGNWEPSRAPDFTEAAYDYVAALKETPK